MVEKKNNRTIKITDSLWAAVNVAAAKQLIYASEFIRIALERSVDMSKHNVNDIKALIRAEIKDLLVVDGKSEMIWKGSNQ